MKKLKEIRQVSGGFLKKFELHYDAGGRDVCWEIISLNDLKTEKDLAGRKTAVEIIARFEDGDYLLCREFRFAVNDYVWEFPTGVIDGDETPREAAARERAFSRSPAWPPGKTRRGIWPYKAGAYGPASPGPR